VFRRGVPISEAPLHYVVDAGIAFETPPGQVPAYEEWEAATAAGLDLWLWEHGGYDAAFKARVVAWHVTHNLVEMHKHDAAQAKIDQQSRSH